ncbi:hypothetical protein [Lactococcus lactis]|uniref:hypothetical protein n=1 Tax=Lactococcus lactis TaxID=1358 RepID=UPI000BFA9604|nr:hypothetical protein [Lactococcus lactis]PFG83259.1 hypothetical protein BW151_06500 [Lactococcus lactis]
MKYKEILRVMAKNSDKEFGFQFFSERTENLKSGNELAEYHAYVPKGSIMAKFKEDATIPGVPILNILKEEWDSIAYFSMNDKKICRRAAYGSDMKILDDEIFQESKYEKMLERASQHFELAEKL